MQLSPHFTLDEFTASQIAARSGIDNTPPPTIVDRLRQTAERLEKVRALLAHPILVSSGYRNGAVNRAARGSKSSAHMSGYAIDFTAPKFGKPYDICQRIAASEIQFDQLIYEFNSWVHISFAPTMRQQLLTIRSVGRKTVVLTGIVL